jgi:hypothetical protein
MNSLLLKIKRKQQAEETEPRPDKKQVYAQLIKNCRKETSSLSRYPVSAAVVEKLRVQNEPRRILEEVGTNTVYTDRKRT